MTFLFEFVAIFCTGVFAGASLYITVVEHPARMQCGTALAVAEFVPSYRRATVMQVSLAVFAFLAAIGVWLTSAAFVWLLGGILIVAVIPFTLIAILPTNKKLLDPFLDRNSDMARQLLIRWGRLHAVRTALSLVAFAVFVSGTIVSLRGDAPTGDSIVGAKEAVLRQDLFQMRSTISQYNLDTQKAPKSLDDLVQAGYLKQIPNDPTTGKPDWTVEWKEGAQHERGVADVHSSSRKISSNGAAYNTW